MATPMNEILSKSEIKAEVLPVTGEAKVETQAPVVETAAKEPVVETKKAEVETDEEGDHHVPDDLDGLKRALAAARGDKRKARKQWQETEKALAKLQGQVEMYQSQGATKAQAVEQAKDDLGITDADFFGDMTGTVKKAASHIARETYKSESALERKERLDWSETLAKEKHPDWDQAWQAFSEAGQRDPSLIERMNRHPDPGEFVYRLGKTMSEVSGVGSLSEYKNKLEQEFKQKYGIAEDGHKPAPAQVIPLPKQSIASARGTGAGVQSQWSGPTPFSEILAR